MMVRGSGGAPWRVGDALGSAGVTPLVVVDPVGVSRGRSEFGAAIGRVIGEYKGGGASSGAATTAGKGQGGRSGKE